VMFVQGPDESTLGDFTVELYEELLMETHDSIITSPYCGQDRWMDNHFAYSTWTVPGLLDDIYEAAKKHDIKFKITKNTAAHAPEHTKLLMEAMDYHGEYIFDMWMIEPTGQSLKMGGIVSDPDVATYADMADPQWCKQECQWGLEEGHVDNTHVYGGNLPKKDVKPEEASNVRIDMMQDLPDEKSKVQYLFYVIFGGLMIILVALAGFGMSYYCVYDRVKNKDYVPI